MVQHGYRELSLFGVIIYLLLLCNGINGINGITQWNSFDQLNVDACAESDTVGRCLSSIPRRHLTDCIYVIELEGMKDTMCMFNSFMTDCTHKSITVDTKTMQSPSSILYLLTRFYLDVNRKNELSFIT